jgi:CRISPR-associated protein Csd2
MSELTKRVDFLMLFDVKDGNPNGDPDAGNLPRIDAQTGHGLMSDVSLKRKVRNFVLQTQSGLKGYDIFVKERGILNNLIEEAYEDLKIDLQADPKKEADGKKRVTKGKGQGGEVDRARDVMCAKYFDIRTFGAVMSTGPNAGQVRGPIQVTFSRSVDPIVSSEHSITRMAVATQKEADDQGGDNRTMGRKATVPYGLYVGHGFVSPQLAAQTKFTAEDLEVFMSALGRMFEFDRSAARGLMSMRRVIVFEHDTALGDAPAHKLFDLVKVVRKASVPVARQFDDYEVTIAAAPKGIKTLEKV